MRPSDAAVRRFATAAAEAAGSQRRVTELLAEAGILQDGKPYSQTAISGWINGHTQKVPAEPLFELARRFGISIDQFVFEHRQLDRLHEVEVRLSVVQERLAELLDDQGRAPLEFPGTEVPAG